MPVDAAKQGLRYPADPPYLQGIDNAELIDTVHAQRALMIPVSTSLRL